MKIKLYPKNLLEAAWRKDKKLYADGDAAEPPRCLRCGAPLAAHLMINALSRYADVQICEACGMDEALRDASHAPLPLTEWDAVKRGRLPAPAKGRVCYLNTVCTFEEVFQHTDTPPMQLTGRPVSEVVYSRSDYDGYQWWTTWHNEPGKKAGAGVGERDRRVPECPVQAACLQNAEYYAAVLQVRAGHQRGDGVQPLFRNRSPVYLDSDDHPVPGLQCLCSLLR